MILLEQRGGEINSFIIIFARASQPSHISLVMCSVRVNKMFLLLSSGKIYASMHRNGSKEKILVSLVHFLFSLASSSSFCSIIREHQQNFPATIKCERYFFLFSPARLYIHFILLTLVMSSYRITLSRWTSFHFYFRAKVIHFQYSIHHSLKSQFSITIKCLFHSVPSTSEVTIKIQCVDDRKFY